MKNPYNNFLQAESIEDIMDKQRGRHDFNLLAHESAHSRNRILWTSSSTISTTAGTKLYPFSGGRIVAVQLFVTGAPSSTLTWKLLKNGNDVFSPDPTIASSSNYGDIVRSIPDDEFTEDDYFQFQISTTGSATGPAVGILDFVPYDWYVK